jgi:hypothetical protein
MRVHVTLTFDRGYIAHPYWPARERVISIRKQSGVDRARSEPKREKALKAYLDTHDMTMEQYRELEAAAARPFYTAEDGEIVIPAHQLHGFMAATAAICPAALRVAKAEQIRTLAEWSDLRTGRAQGDGVYERFVRNPLTNQRRLETNSYIAKFTAEGELRLVNADLEKRVREFIAYGGEEIGIGAARKMGWGRFRLTGWEPQGG